MVYITDILGGGGIVIRAISSASNLSVVMLSPKTESENLQELNMRQEIKEKSKDVKRN